MGEKIAQGDVVYLDYDLWIAQPDGTHRLHETTNEALAKQENVHEEKRVYAPIAVAVGAERLMAGFEEALLESSVGEEREVVIPPAKGAGGRDPKLVQLHTLREFQRREIDPHVGMEVSVGGKRGYVTAVTAGRVRVDFNDPLAGRTVKYKFKVLRKAETPEDRIRAVLDMDFGLPEQFGVEVSGDAADLTVADLCKTDEKWFVSKFRVVADLRRHAGLRTIRFIEKYEEKGPKAEEPQATATVETQTAAEAPEEKPAEEAPVEEELAEEELPAEPETKAPAAEAKGQRRRSAKETAAKD